MYHVAMYVLCASLQQGASSRAALHCKVKLYCRLYLRLMFKLVVRVIPDSEKVWRRRTLSHSALSLYIECDGLFLLLLHNNNMN